MNKKTFNKLIKINQKFYETTAQKFSTTRQYPWKGWGKIRKYIKQGDTILDLGCGNGRFYEYIHSQKVNYKGLDSNKALLKKAQLLGANVELFDIIQDLEKIEGAYNAIIIFGLTHHLPSREFRKHWFETLPNLLLENGVLAITFWNFETKGLKKASGESGDFFVGWDNKEDLYRYCHRYSKNELTKIEKLLKTKGCELIASFESDGKNNNSNTYQIYKKPLSTWFNKPANRG